MPWDDQQANCVLEVCCGKDGKQLQALTAVLQAEAGLDAHHALQAATWLVMTLDFAPKGSLYAFKQEIARLARGQDYE
jgi:hypothetical protein